MSRAFVNSPTARQGVNDLKTASAYVVGAAFSHLPLEAAPLVDHLTEHTVAVDTNGDRDRALTVRNGIRDQLRHHEHEFANPLASELVRKPLIQGLPSDAGGRVVARQAKAEFDGHRNPMREKWPGAVATPCRS